MISVTGLNLATVDPAADAAAYKAHYDKIACEFPEIAAIYDFRHPLCRPAGAITTATLFKNLVKGGPDLITTMAPGLSLRPNALRFNGGAYPAVNQAQCKLDASIRPFSTVKQYGFLMYFTPVGTGTASAGLLRAGIGTSVNGFSATAPTTASARVSGRMDGGNNDGVYPPTDKYPYASTSWMAPTGVPTRIGMGYYNDGAALLSSIRTSVKDGVVTASTYTNDGVIADIDAGGTDLFIGNNGINAQNGTIFDLHRLVIVRMAATEPKNPFRIIAKRDWELYGAGVMAGYTPA